MTSFAQCTGSLDSSSNITKTTPSRPPTIWLGAVIYHWGESFQNRLLLSGYLPWIEAASREHLADRCWYARYDTRGPHLFFLFRTTRRAFAPLTKFLTRAISSFLAREPSTISYSTSSLRYLHGFCRGRSMCEVDRHKGVGTNNTYAIFAHPPNSFPLSLVSAERRDRFGGELDRVSRWALSSLHRNPSSNAVQWIAGVDRALDRLGIDKAAYWAYHFASLAAPGTVLQTPKELAATVSPANRSLFDMLWTNRIESPDGEFDVARLLHTAAGGASGASRNFHSMREVNHCVLNQLGLPCRLEIPLVLYAWCRAAKHVGVSPDR